MKQVERKKKKERTNQRERGEKCRIGMKTLKTKRRKKGEKEGGNEVKLEDNEVKKIIF